MVQRLDAPQPTFFLPPLEQIPDDDNDRPKPGIQIVSQLLGTPSSNGADSSDKTTYIGEIPAVIFGAAAFCNSYSTDDHIRSVTPLRVTRLALRCVCGTFLLIVSDG